MKSCLRLGIALSLASGLMAVAFAAELEPGMKAPALKFSEFVKGKEVKAFQPGHVYVVEFWATWCGPCIDGMPHLSELQSKYKGKVTVIGVNAFERGENVAENVKGFVKKQGDKMAYTVARDADNFMATNWMTAAGQNGIPAAFVVNQKGVIAWIGHPGMMDETLDQVVNGTFDLEKSKADFRAQAAANEKRMATVKRIAELEKMYGSGKKTEALAELDKLAHGDPSLVMNVDLAKVKLLIGDDFSQADRVVRDRVALDTEGNSMNMFLFNFIMRPLTVKESDQSAYDKLVDDVASHLLSKAPEGDYFMPLNIASVYMSHKKYDRALELAEKGKKLYEADPKKDPQYAKLFDDAVKRIQEAKKAAG